MFKADGLFAFLHLSDKYLSELIRLGNSVEDGLVTFAALCTD